MRRFGLFLYRAVLDGLAVMLKPSLPMGGEGPLSSIMAEED